MANPFAEKAISMVAVNENTGSNTLIIQNTSSQKKLSNSSELFKDLLQLFLSQVYIALENHTFLIEFFWIEVMDLEWVLLSIPVLRDFGVGELLLKEFHQMENKSI